MRPDMPRQRILSGLLTKPGTQAPSHPALLQLQAAPPVHATLVHASSDRSLSMLRTPTSAVLQMWSPDPEPRSGNSHQTNSSLYLKIQLKCPTFPVHLKQAWSLPSLWHFRHPCIPVFLYLSRFSPEPLIHFCTTESWGDAKLTADPR